MKRNMNKKVLICVVAELRASEKTFKSFKKNLLDPNKADLLICAPLAKDEEYQNNPYYKNAKYIETFDSTKTINQYYKDIAKKMNSKEDWKRLMQIKSLWLGGIKDLRLTTIIREIIKILKRGKFHGLKDSLNMLNNWILRKKGPLDQLGGAAYVLLYRHLLLETIINRKLDEKYERFIITRSDHMYGAFHPKIDLLNPKYVWIPEGEDWRGYCDRHWVLSKQHLRPCLNLLEPIFNQTNNLFERMSSKLDWNSESYIKLIFDMNNIQVKRFPRIQFLIRGSKKTQTWTEGVYNPDLKLTIAYPTEYENAKLNFNNFKKIEDWDSYFEKHIPLSVIGSCRVFNPIKTTNIKTNHQYATWNTHYTKEIIQKIKIVNKELLVPKEYEPLINQTGSLNQTKFHKNFYSDSNIFIIEISSMKKFTYKNLYCNQWSIRDILRNSNSKKELYKIAQIINQHMELQTKEEIIEDLDTICKLVNKKIIFVNPINISKDDGSKFKERSLLHNILKNYCDNKKTFLFDPTEIVNRYPIKYALIDSSHYTTQFEKIIGRELISLAMRSAD